MATWIWVVIAIVVVAVIALVAVGASKRRTAMLRDRFGPEYDRAVEGRDGRRAAEADLRAREKQRAQFDIKPLPEAARVRFAGEWRDVQELFVEQPVQAADAADALIIRVMEARGYPMQDFDAQAELISVDHPDTVENYRIAHAVGQRSLTEQVSTEDLREALLRYRSLFDELLRPEGNGAAAVAADEARPTGYANGQRVPAEPEAQALADEPAAGEIDSDDFPAQETEETEYDDQRIGRRDV
jgi:hypothetical protein